MITPLFRTHYSIGESILTLDLDKKRQEGEPIIKANCPVSVMDIQESYKLDKVVLVESNLSSYFQAYTVSKEKNVPVLYGVKLTLANSVECLEPVESQVIIFLKNTQGYKDFLKIYNKAATIDYLGSARVDCDGLRKMWTNNLKMAIPFYNSFLAKNSLKLSSTCNPDFRDLEPTFFVSSHDHPYDQLLTPIVQEYCKNYNYPIEQTHNIKYYRDSDAKYFQTFKCIHGENDKGARPTLESPNLEHFCSDKFSFQHFLTRTGKTLI